MDIYFYTLDFSDKRILPPFSKTIGYISMNTTIELCGNGNFELVFYSDEIEAFAEAHPEGLFVVWGDFEGFMTDWQFKEKEKRLFGSHLNSIIHKVVVSSGTASDVNSALSTIANGINWLGYDALASNMTITSYTSDKHMNADKFLQEYLSKSKWGYSIYIKNKTAGASPNLYLKAISPQQISLILSKSNLNVYEIQEDYSNKNVAYRGWYKVTTEEKDANGETIKNEEWKIYTLANKNGIFMQDVVLSANNETAAKEEMSKYKKEHDITCKTRNIKYGVDYKLGDVVRLQHKGKMVKKQISSVSLWYEGSTYHEEPTLVDN